MSISKSFSGQAPSSAFVKAHAAQEVYHHLQKLTGDRIVFLDVDDTLITPVSRSFRAIHAGPVKNLIDEIKSSPEKYPQFEDIISAWRLQRQIRLTDQAWPVVLKALKKQGPVYALTQMNTGPFGQIESMERWRHQELAHLDLLFSPSPGEHRPTAPAKNYPAFYQGILMTGDKTKAETLQAFGAHLKAPTFVMVDDRAHHLEDIGALCAKENKNFLGILYEEKLPLESPQDPKIYALQKTTLIEEKRWLEDEDALAEL